MGGESMARTPLKDLKRELEENPEFARLYGAEQAKTEFAVTLAKARRSSGMTQKELARRIGRSQPYVAKLERGDANPSLGTVGSLLAVLNLRVVMRTEPLLTESEDPQDSDALAIGAVHESKGAK
jgi:ribosome-binding protein aMBF1 (putative translation factor)